MSEAKDRDAKGQFGVRALVGALFISVILNVHFLTYSTSATKHSRSWRHIPMSRSPVRASTVAHKQYVVPEHFRALDRATLERRLLEADIELESKLLPYDRYEHNIERTPENEERLRPLLDKVFRMSDGSASYALECHARTCRIESVDMLNWQDAFQTDPVLFGVIGDSQFLPGQVYFHLNEPSHSAGVQLFLSIMVALRRSPVVDKCRSSSLEDGTIEVSLTIDTDTREIQVQVYTARDSESLGLCIRAEAMKVANLHTVPSEVTTLPEWTFTLDR